MFNTNDRCLRQAGGAGALVQPATPVKLEVALEITKVRVPALADVPYPVQMEPHFVVEYYSR